ncbi:MAG TPA: hypothetical protein VKX17_26530 [Planctomycetota bacterium]|nr:hypothetical protein [Planctomycetota bacterium]
MSASVLDWNTKVTDSEILNRVHPRNLEDYLQSKGWKSHCEMPSEWHSWRKGKRGDEIEIVVPLDRTFGDYAARIYDAVATLAKVEKRSQISILDDLGVTPVNVLARISDEAKAIAKSGKTPSRVYLDNATLWDFGKLTEAQTGARFQKIFAEQGPRAALEKAFGGKISGLKIVFDADHFKVE